jgi:hypothetical protein
MALKFRRGTTAQQSGSLAFGEPYVNTTLGTLLIGGPTGDIVLSTTGTGSTGTFGAISGSGLDITGNANIAGNLTLGGTITIGDNSSDNVVVNADLSSSIIPNNDNSFDLGSTSFRYRAIHGTNIYGTINATNGVISGSSQLPTLATTGSNTFRGNQTIIGSGAGFAAYISTSVNDATLGLDTTANVNALYFLKNGEKNFEISYDTTNANGIFRLLPYDNNSFFEIGNPSNSGANYVFISEPTYGNVLIGPGIGNGVSSLSGSIPATDKVQIAGNLYVSGAINATSFSGQILANNGVLSGSLVAQLPAGVVSGSSQVIGILSSLNTYTGSNDTTNTTQNTRLTALEASASTALSTNNSQATSITNLNSATASLIIETTNLELFSASVLTRLTEVGVVTGSLISSASAAAIANTNQNTFTASANTSISNLNTTTASLNTSVSNINTTTASLNTSVSNINSYTSSLKTALSLSGADLTVLGNLTVQGDTTTLNTANLLVEDKLIELAIGTTSSAAANGAGIYISGANASILWDNAASSLDINKSIDIAGNITLTGTVDGVDVSILNTNVNSTTASLNTSVSNLNTYTASVSTSVSNLNTFSSSQLSKDSTLATLTASYDGRFTTLGTYTASVDGRFTTLATTTGSINTSITNLNTFTASVSTGSLVTSITNLNLSSASQQVSIDNLNTFSGSQLGKDSTLATYTGSVEGRFSTLATLTGSNATRLTNLETTTASLNTSVSNLNSFSSSQLGKDSTLATYTGSVDGRFTTLATTTGSLQTSVTNLNTFSGSALTRLTALEVETANLETFSSSALTRLTALEVETSNLETFSGSQLGKDATLATVTASYDGRFTTLGTYTGSVETRLTQVGVVTGSLITSASTLTQRVGAIEAVSGTFARTNSANVFTGNQTITGSLFVTQDLVVGGSSSIQNISSSNLVIGTAFVTLNTATPSSRFAGLQIVDSGSSGGSGSFLYDAVQDELIFVHRGNGTNLTSSVLLMGPQTYDNLGNETQLTNNRIVKSAGLEHIVDSQISDDGTTVSIPGALTVTGNITGPIRATNGVVSGSSQITYSGLTGIPAGIVSGSSQLSSILPAGVVSGSSQVVGILSSLNSYTASNDTTNTTQNSRLDQLSTASGSAITRLTALEVETSNLETYTSSFAAASVALTNKTISGASNTLSNIANASLTNSSITIAGTSTALGSSITAATILQGTGVVSGSSQITAGSTTNFATDVKTQLNSNTVVSGSSQIAIASVSGYDANRWVDHTAVSISAGNGLSGGGTIAATRTLSLDTTSATFTTGVTTQNNALGVVSGSRTISGITLGSNLATLTIGTGLSGTSYNGSTGVTIANTGVLSVTTNTGLSSNVSATGNVTITNTGVTGITAGTGISRDVATGGVTITNTGVTSAVAGTGVSVSGATGAVTISIGQAVATSSSPTFAGLTINGAITATGDITAFFTSDKRHKNNIQIIQNALEKVRTLNGVTWEWNDDVNEVTKAAPKTGLIAQEVQAVLPEVVKEKEDGYLGLDYSKMMGLMVEAIKEQQLQIEKLQLEVADLKKQKGL